MNNNEIKIVKKEKEGEILSPPANFREFLKMAIEVANDLRRIIDTYDLSINIKGKKHVKCEGWTTLAFLMGFSPTVSDIEIIEKSNGEIIVKVKATLKRKNKKIEAYGVCSNKEANWSGKDLYALVSMAQTRAIAKACKIGFSFIMSLAGYEPTPYEEISETENHNYITQEQGKKLTSELYEKNIPFSIFTKKILSKYNIKSINEIPQNLFEKILQDIQNYKKEQ